MGRASIERHGTFSLAIVEFDDQGTFWDRRQVDALEAEIRRVGQGPGEPGALIPVFVHGWQHNADVCDGYLSCFRETLRLAAEDQRGVLALSGRDGQPASIVGVYVGWRGRSRRGWLANQLSFLSRRKTAVKVGEGDMMEFLARLEGLRDEMHALGGRKSRLVVLGHSLGATVVYSALSGVLKGRLAEALYMPRPPEGQARVIRGFGDLVVLLNPALDAVSFRPVWELASRFPAFARTQAPILVVVGSETDTVTGRFFPLGQEIGTHFERTRDAEQRRALRTAVANYEPYVSYRLSAVVPEARSLPSEPILDGCYCSQPYRRITESEAMELAGLGKALEASAISGSTLSTGTSWGSARCPAERILGGTRLACVKPVRRGNPIWVVRAAPEILHGHSSASALMGDFLRRLLIGGAIEPTGSGAPVGTP